MNNRIKPLWILVVVIIVVVGFLVWRKSSKPQSETIAEPAAESTPVSTTEHAASAVPESAPEQPAAEESVIAEPEVAAPVVADSVAPVSTPAVVEATNANTIKFKGDSFPVTAGVVLAKVNDVEISLKDLMPIVPAVTTERTVAAADFEKLLQRAIDREIILDTARRNNIQLDDEQRRTVEKARLSAGAKGFTLPDTERPEYEAKSNFESMELLSTLLGEGIAKAKGGPAKESVSEQEYQKYIRGMLDDLRTNNSVTVNAVVE